MHYMQVSFLALQVLQYIPHDLPGFDGRNVTRPDQPASAAAQLEEHVTSFNRPRIRSSRHEMFSLWQHSPHLIPSGFLPWKSFILITFGQLVPRSSRHSSTLHFGSNSFCKLPIPSPLFLMQRWRLGLCVASSWSRTIPRIEDFSQIPSERTATRGIARHPGTFITDSEPIPPIGSWL